MENETKMAEVITLLRALGKNVSSKDMPTKLILFEAADRLEKSEKTLKNRRSIQWLSA